MRGFFKKLGKASVATVKVVAPVVIASAMPESVINTVAGGAVKHSKKFNNQAIPVMNLVGSVAVRYAMNVASTGDWAASLGPALQEGGALMGISTALHQSIKIPIKQVTGRSL